MMMKEQKSLNELWDIMEIFHIADTPILSLSQLGHFNDY